MTVRPMLRLVILALVVLGSASAAHAQLVSVTGTLDRRLTVNGAVELDVRTGSGSIDIRRGSGGEVRVVGQIRAQRGFWNSLSAEDRVKQIEANPPISQNGNSIRIGEFPDEDLGRNVSISYVISVPAETSVRARTGSGSHRIASLTGGVEAQTGSGSIHLGQISGPVVASTGSGSIEIMGASAGLTAKTGSGSIEAAGVRGALRANTGSGGVRIEGTPTSDWSIQTGSGSIGLRLPADASFDLDARSSSGSINTNHPIEMRGSLSRRHVQGRVRGGGPRIDVSAGSGSIQLQ